SLGAIDSNKGLFNYRQVLPVDTVIVRCALEGLIKTIIFLIFIFLGAWLRFDFLPDDSMESIYVWCTLWMIGLASGMVFSVLNTLYTDIGRIVKICMLPLLILSGTLMPINYLPVDI
ncbi:ABC transporter permease, partial [Staphylococcus pasteuri_A]|nr:ABC transporter permease [Staphylococcus pasteuri_A]